MNQPRPDIDPRPIPEIIPQPEPRQPEPVEPYPAPPQEWPDTTQPIEDPEPGTPPGPPDQPRA
jgi:hypothetical protein